jgi:hypothetical protein
MTFIEKHIVKILIGFGIAFLILFLQNCGNSRKIGKLEKQDRIQNALIDSIPTSREMQKALVIEGLKSEKRMIQATDRKMLDVNRQTAIDEELKKLEATPK